MHDNLVVVSANTMRCSRDYNYYVHSEYNYISFVNEAAKCVEDEIIEDFVAGDIGLVFGTGFAPFRGGPFRYLDQVGVANYADMMNGFADKYGPQFEPCQLIKDYAASGKKFHR